MIIGIVTRIDKKKNIQKLYITDNYKKIFDKLNITLFPIVSGKNIEKIARISDALIIPGSSININPKYYNELPIKEIKYDIDEFKLDKKAILAFHKLNKPILGICAGIQSINVAFGGTLNQKIDAHNIDSYHDINITQNSFVYDVYKNKKAIVNSFHIQSINKVADNFKVTAKANDGTIEAIENGNIIGVQWHPEKNNNIVFFEKFIGKHLKKDNK